MKDNSDFRDLIAPLSQQMYVLRMAISKRWSAEARLGHAREWRNQLRQALRATERFIETEEREVHNDDA